MAQIQTVNHYHRGMSNVEHQYSEETQQQQPFHEDEDEIELNKSTTDTSALEARSGKDIQAIPWERMVHTRDEYRQMRLKEYKNYHNLPPKENKKEYKHADKGSTFYDFQFNTRLVKPTIVHFQMGFSLAVSGSTIPFCADDSFDGVIASMTFNELKKCVLPLSTKKASWSCYCGAGWIKQPMHMLRNMLWASSKHDVYLMQNSSFMHWSSLLRRGKEVLNVGGQIVPTKKRLGGFTRELSRVQISTMAIKNNLMVAGGFHGELICKNLSSPGVAFCTKMTHTQNAITNTVDIYWSPNGSMRVMTANNDEQVRVFDAESFGLLNNFYFPWSVNNTSANPDGKLLAVLGDSADCLIADTQSGKVIERLKGHTDYSFSSAWHPNGHILATGNQDKTCRLWDVRKMFESVSVLEGRMGAIRTIKFTSDGRFMAIAEAADFVHIYDTHSGYSKEQEIDLFGEIAGISFSPDTEAFYVSVTDRTYGSLMEFNRKRHNYYLDTII